MLEMMSHIEVEAQYVVKPGRVTVAGETVIRPQPCLDNASSFQ